MTFKLYSFYYAMLIILNKSLMKNFYIISFLLIFTSQFAFHNVKAQCSTPATGINRSNPIQIGFINPTCQTSYSSVLDTYCYGNNYDAAGPLYNTNGQASNDIFYQFTLTNTGNITLSPCGPGFQEYLHLLDSNGNWLATSSGYCGQSGSIITQSLASGTYYIVAEKPGTTNGSIFFSLTTSGPPAPVGAGMFNAVNVGAVSICGQAYTNTQNNSPGNCFGNHYDSRLTNTPTGQSSDDIFYRFTLSESATVNINTCGSTTTSGSTLDTFLHLLDANGAQLAYDDDNGPLCSGLSASLQQSLGPGTYYVVVEGWSSNAGNILTSIQTYGTGSSAPLISVTPSAPAVDAGFSVALTASGACSYSWAPATGLSATNSVNGTSITATPATTTTYTVTGTTYNGRTGTATVTVTVKQNMNSVATNTVLVPGKMTAADVINMANYNSSTGELERKQQITYLDGLGRPVQNIQVQGSPSKLDVVEPIVYDQVGRTPTTYLPFTGGSTGLGTNGYYQADALTQQGLFYQPNSTLTRVAKDNTPSATQVYDGSPLNRVLEQGAPGATWQPGTGHTTRVTHRTNTSGEVREWVYDYATGICSAATTYPAGTLIVTETRDGQDGLVTTYVNTEGKTILRQVEAASGSANSLLTYYVYDDSNNLRLTISPQGYVNLPTSFTWPDANSYLAFARNWCFRYTYDGRGRLIEKQLPGTDATRMVYNKNDQVILIQDGKQRANNGNSWTFSKYDALNRLVMTGTIGLAKSQADLQADVEAETILFEAPDASSVGYTFNTAYPRGITESNLLTINYYDKYNYGYQQDSRVLGSVSTKTNFVRGLLTGASVRQVGPNGPITTSWLTSVNMYDSESRLIQTRSLNHLSGVDDMVTVYDFAGQVRETHLTHTNYSNTPYKIDNRFTYYTTTGRVLTAYQSTGGQPEIILSQVRYNELGQAVDKRLHNPSWQFSNVFMQKVDFRYNIRGWMTNINDRDLSNGTAVEGQVADPDGSIADPDLFGMDICYNDRLHKGLAQYTGNIAEVLWKTRKPATQGSDPANILRDYAYSYDRANRITLADYNTYENNAFVKNLTDFSASNITYDNNGNLLSMTRMGTVNGSNATPVKGVLDQLTYYYSPTTGNQLQGVIDGASASNSSPTQDFKGGAQKLYEYDENGNLKTNQQKTINSAISYNLLNQPTSISLAANRIEYTYTATGTKLQKRAYSYGSLVSTTDYVGPFVYQTPASQTGPPVPAFAQTTEGRVLFTSGTTAPSLAWKYEYFLKDHLGNLRYAFRADKDNSGATTQLKAGMELASATTEEQQFQHVAETRLADPNHARTGSYVARLNAQMGRRDGPSIRVKVAAGDSIRAEVYGRYDRGIVAGSLFQKGALLAGGLTAGIPSSTGTDQIQPVTAQRRWLPFVGASLAVIPQLLTAKRAQLPIAYLRYDVFNKDSQLVSTKMQPIQRTAVDEWQHIQAGTKVDSAGFVQVSLVNESRIPAYFDDFTLSTVAPSPYQENHYDPFGLNLVGIEQDDVPNSTFQYNGKEKQEDFGLNWTDYGARMYDAQLGRWHTIDPLAETSITNSPYVYGLNNPVLFIDPNGMASRYNWDNKTYEDEQGKEVSWKQVQKEYGISPNDGESESSEQGSSNVSNIPWLPFKKSDLASYYSNRHNNAVGSENDLGDEFENIFEDYSSSANPRITRNNNPAIRFGSPLGDPNSRNTEPDFVGSSLMYGLLPIQNSRWFELKAKGGGLYLSSNQYQMQGHIDNLAYEFRQEITNYLFRPNLTLVTTADVSFSKTMRIYANRHRVAYQHFISQYRTIGPLVQFRFVPAKGSLP